jgi:hypothetical protein
LFCRCAKQLLKRNEEQLQPGIQKLLTNMMDGNKTESELEGDYPTLLLEVCALGFWHVGLKVCLVFKT